MSGVPLNLSMLEDWPCCVFFPLGSKVQIRNMFVAVYNIVHVSY